MYVPAAVCVTCVSRCAGAMTISAVQQPAQQPASLPSNLTPRELTRRSLTDTVDFKGLARPSATECAPCRLRDTCLRAQQQAGALSARLTLPLSCRSIGG